MDGEDPLARRSCRGCRPASSPSGRGSPGRPSRARPPCRRRRRCRRSRRRARRSGPSRRPRASRFGSIIGCSSWSSCDGSMREIASSREISPSSTIVTRRLQRRGRRALRRARLQQVELLVLDGELDVLHVAVVLLEPAHRLDELVERLRHRRRASPRSAAACGCPRRRPRPARSRGTRRRARLARRRVARERDARARAVALVAEHHLHDVHRGAEVVGDVVRAPVDLRARRVPRLEDGAHGAEQLLARVRRGSPRPSPRGRSRWNVSTSSRRSSAERSVSCCTARSLLERRRARSRSGARRCRRRPRRTSGSAGGSES